MLRKPSTDIAEPIEFLCLVCSQPFNNTDRVPIIVCSRSHSCCTHCFETRLFHNIEENNQVFCFHCHLPIQKNDAKKFQHFEEVKKTAVHLSTQDASSSKSHQVEGEEDIEHIKTQLAQEKTKNEWLLQQYTTLERTYHHAALKQIASDADYERRIKKHQRNIDHLSRLTWGSRGDQLFIDRKFKEAIQICQFILKAAPGIDYDIIGMGNVEDRAGISDSDVISWYKQHSRQSSNPYDVLCLSFNQLENYAQAQSWYSYRLGKDKDNYRIIFGLANVLYNSGKYEEAQKLYLRVIELKPDFEKSYRQLAFIKTVRENKKEEGKKWATIAKGKNAESFYADYLLAISQETNDTQIQKLTHLSETLGKTYPRIYNALGFVFKQKKEYDEAIKCFKICIQVNSSYEVPYYNLGLIHQERGQHDEAVRYYEESVKRNEKYVNAYLGLGNLFAKRKGEEEKAISWYQKCLQASPSSIPAHNGLGRVHAIKEQYDQAIKSFQKCIQLNQKHELSYNSLGNVYFYRGQYDEAIKWFQKCIQINPKYLGPYNGLCNAYGKKGDEDEARKWCDKRNAISAPAS